MTTQLPPFQVTRLHWTDEPLGAIDLPGARMDIRASFGSGLSIRRGDQPGRVWAVGDRGPNLKIRTLVERYGLDALSKHSDLAGAKVMPRLDLGPQIAELQILDDRVELVAGHRIRGADGRPASGLPIPGGAHARSEPALDLEGNALDPDPSGLDSEGIAALGDGGFWVSDEFGPSLVRLDSDARILARHMPEGAVTRGADYPVHMSLPAIAAKRHLNRGFEAIALSPDERWLFVAFQSPMAHPDEAAHERARHVRFWKLDAETLRLVAEYLYPLDPPSTFRRDCEKGEVKLRDLKVSEFIALAEDQLLVLERGSKTTKIYRCQLGESFALHPRFVDLAQRPTVEELSAGEDFELAELPKTLIFTTDEAPDVAADLEGMALLSPHELLLVNDNDFGVDGVSTSFWKINFEWPIHPFHRDGVRSS